MSSRSWASSPANRASMHGNRRVDTVPEVALRKELHRRGLRFRKDMRIDLASTRVRPDVIFTRQKLAVFVDGCFWHCCPEHGTRPSRNSDYWTPKLARNVERDVEQTKALRAEGWTVLRFWEHESPAVAAARVLDVLRAAGP